MSRIEWTRGSEAHHFIGKSAGGVSDLEQVYAEVLVFVYRNLLPVANWPNSLCVELWLDSGKVVVFPGVEHRRRRNEVACAQILLQEASEFAESLFDQELSEDEILDQLAAEERRHATAFLSALRTQKTHLETADPRSQATIRVAFFESEEAEPFLDVSVT